jgi:hypothetical protein
MAVRAAEAWSIARFCALVAKEADDDLMSKSLIGIRDVWIDIANECELQSGRRESRAARAGLSNRKRRSSKLLDD